MTKCKLCCSLILLWIYIVFIEAVKKGICEKCVKIEDCPTFAGMTIQEQQMWLRQVPCDNSRVNEKSSMFVLSVIEKGDYICCPNSNNRIIEYDNGHNYYKPASPKSNKNIKKRSIINHRNRRIFRNVLNTKFNNDNSRPFYPNQDNVQHSKKPSPNLLPSPYFTPKPYSYPEQQSTYLNYGNSNMFGDANSNVQCTVQKSTPPDPATGCCGRDMSDSYSVTDLQSILNILALPIENTRTNESQRLYQNPQRHRRFAEYMTDDDMLDDRIAGGKATELDEFPWTVHLNIIFAIGNQHVAFTCGGSLISSKYVLTAGHCVFNNGDKIVDIEVMLAEYDKRTFPRDCGYIGIGLQEERKCITNVLLHGKNVIIHPQYDDDRLYNDIALIELNEYAPYTRYIRPICLPPINIDDPVFSNLPLAVAGWGRNGKYNTDVKQSTVVRLVPHYECEISYSRLLNTQLCAAGRTGEDTCKGDSGGPLMLLYGGNYYVVGVVSGKRSDSPCGSRVPSLYANVYHYVPWIKSVIRS